VRALLDDERDEAETPRVAAVVPAREDRVIGLELVEDESMAGLRRRGP